MGTFNYIFKIALTLTLIWTPLLLQHFKLVDTFQLLLPPLIVDVNFANWLSSHLESWRLWKSGMPQLPYSWTITSSIWSFTFHTLAKGLESIETFITIIGPSSSRELELGVDVLRHGYAINQTLTSLPNVVFCCMSICNIYLHSNTWSHYQVAFLHPSLFEFPIFSSFKVSCTCDHSKFPPQKWN
jgi:hypothetical protein